MDLQGKCINAYMPRRVCSFNFTELTQSLLYGSVSIFLYFATVVKQVKALFDFHSDVKTRFSAAVEQALSGGG